MQAGSDTLPTHTPLHPSALPQPSLPLVIEADDRDINLTTWVSQNKQDLGDRLQHHGAILFRNFQLAGIPDFEHSIQTLVGDLIPYHDRATPRKTVQGNIYTSTEYPPSHRIFLHNENSFAATWPQKLFFYCMTAPTQGGETPIADIAAVFQAIRPATRAKFLQTGVMYVRNFGHGYGLSWQEVFGTTDRAALAAFCQTADIELEWCGPDHLRTRQVRPAALKHPQTGHMVWFNHAAVLHVSTLPPKLQAAMLAEFAIADLPNNTYYGDGSPIESDVLDEIRAAYDQATVTFPWQVGDVLWLDNLRVAHGRAPFTGPRKVVVGMGEPKTWASLNTDRLPPLSTLNHPPQESAPARSGVVTTADPANPPAAAKPHTAKPNYVAPRTDLESMLVNIWQTTMNIAPIGIHDNFFELGGQSLDATDIISEIQTILQVPLSLLALNQTPTIAELASALEANPDDRARIHQVAQLHNDISQLSDAEVEALLHHSQP